MAKINSRAKGARGERELAKLFVANGFKARRGQQFSGGPESPDIIVEGLPDFHFECKRVERGNPYDWFYQAAGDCKDQYPIVAHKRNGQAKWLGILDLELLITLIKAYKAQEGVS